MGTIVLIFVTYGAMALGGTESLGTDYVGELGAVENQTAQAAGILGVLLALFLISTSSEADRALRGVALALAAVALAAPAVYISAHDVTVSDTVVCGTVSNPRIISTPVERASCEDRLRKQKVLVAFVALVPTGVAIASVVVLARGPRPNEK